ncbi:CLIP domain-containing serine protease B10-like [Phlebotomus papatasi]|uniref:CLIP domain-containing serine protease B10-like n=1 Tax=Phlebotomus papatasi TaxID=29031 RepID=UPI00248342A9|nr:CLIP domain-containing serine protease B10-like [Phlebotomus papatasi]XP_055697811.1 CLIP domain-containing serine protease B10-like [Phlebotomus papatasi]
MNWRELLLYVTLTLSLLNQTNGQTPCETPNGNIGECISIYDCPAVLRLLLNSMMTPDTIEGLRKLQCSGEPNKGVFVCCEQSRVRMSSDVRSNQIVTPSNNRGNRISPRCGYERLGKRIIGGTVSNIKESPWMALLEYERKNGTWIHACGGFLISNRYIITAAHCVVGEKLDKLGKLVNIRIREYNTSTDPDCINDGTKEICNGPVMNFGIEEIIPHEDYIPDNPFNIQNDIALIRLTGNIGDVNPICLPSPDFPGTPVGSNVTVAGWGRTLDQKRSTVKMKVSIPVVSFERCLAEYARKTNLSKDLQICAGGEFLKDSCVGDSGGPLMTKQRYGWIAEGIVSFGIGCGSEISSVYTKVSAYVPWILSNMKP